MKKKYKTDMECIQWLNRHLSKYYNASHVQAVAQHEFSALALLAPYGFTPKPLGMETGSITMEFAGEPLAADSEISLDEYEKQCRIILNAFSRLKFRHNDLLEGNILVLNGRIKIVDFTLSEFNGIEIMKQLPNRNWARPGRDKDIRNYLPLMRRHKRNFVGAILNRLIKREFPVL